MADQVAAPLAVPNHQLARSHFDALCAGFGNAEVIRELWRTQRSRRLLLISAVVDITQATPDLPGPLPPASAAWRVLVDAEQMAPAEFTGLLLHPQVGNWAAYVLRRHRGWAGSTAPLWVDFGGLHAFALVAAALAGLTWSTRVPARAGQVMLPTLGMASMPDQARWTAIDAETANGQVLLRHADGEFVVPWQSMDDVVDGPASWRSLRRIEVGTGPRLSVTLQDLDPFRDLADPVAPMRLGPTAVARWMGLLDSAWAILCENHRETAEAMALGIVSLVPLPGEGSETRSASTGEAFGSVLVSLPPDATTLAVSLVHEFQHIKLGGLMHLGPLTTGGERQLYYAPWRDDPRHISGLIQGIYAFIGICAFWREYRRTGQGIEARMADFEYAYARLQVDDALRTVSKSRRLTDWGRRVAEQLGERLQLWLSEPLAPESIHAAALLAKSHRAGWRIRHVRPAAADVRALAGAWPAGRHIQIEVCNTDIVPHPQLRWSSGLRALVRHHVDGDAGRLGIEMRSHGLTEADVALVHGDLETAIAGYEARVQVSHNDLDAWVGLGLAAESCSALLRLPQLVRAVYISLLDGGHAPKPSLLAEWVDHATVLTES